MVITSVFNTFEKILIQIFGSLEVFAAVILIVILLGLLFSHVDFRYALLIDSILAVGLSGGGTSGGWLPGWVGLLGWIFVVGFGGYIVVMKMRGEF